MSKILTQALLIIKNMPKKKVTIENLATMVKKGFDETQKDINNVRNEMQEGFKKIDEKFKKVDESFKRADERLKYTNSRLDVIERDIKDFVNRDEFEDVLSRLKLIEKTIGLKI